MSRLPMRASVVLQRELRKISIPIRLPSSSVLFAQNEHAKGIYLIEEGSVSLLLQARRGGKTVCQRALGRGSLLGLPATINDTAYSLTAIALCDVDLAFVPKETIIEAMRRNGTLAMEILKVLSYEIQDMRAVLRECCRKGSPARLKQLTSTGRNVKR